LSSREPGETSADRRGGLLPWTRQEATMSRSPPRLAGLRWPTKSQFFLRSPRGGCVFTRWCRVWTGRGGEGREHSNPRYGFEMAQLPCAWLGRRMPAPRGRAILEATGSWSLVLGDDPAVSGIVFAYRTGIAVAFDRFSLLLRLYCIQADRIRSPES